MTKSRNIWRETETRFHSQFPEFHLGLRGINQHSVEVTIEQVNKYGYKHLWQGRVPYNGTIQLPDNFQINGEPFRIKVHD
jgi:hypothetical protein